MRPLYLVSISPRRKALLKSFGLSFRILKPRYQEENNFSPSPSKTVQTHAWAKAQSVKGIVTQGTVLAADTIVYFKGRIIGKPKNLKEAVKILNGLQGRWHSVYTGVALAEFRTGRLTGKKVFFEKTKVLLKPLTRDEISAYFKKINPLDKAGAYAIQAKRGSIVQAVDGSFSNAMGLPMESLRRHLKAFLPQRN